MTASDLNKIGYFYDPAARIWSRTATGEFAYSDGDEAEQRMASIVASAHDLSVMSEELSAHCTDWPSRYHLSHQRANLLRPFAGGLKGRVLEIGAGCGAITRFLGEQGGSIVAVEGSARRASIAASRTRDLENVAVIHDHFDSFEAEEKFDVVTLIGVLEYARVYGEGEDPIQAMLERARSFLKPTGTLIVAIENQLGLKYLAGLPEDHIGVPMYGVQDSYQPRGVVTFGREELRERIARAGFARVELALPLPDYKLPVSVVLPAGLNRDSAFDPAVLAAQTVKSDYQLHVAPTFSIERAYGVIGRNGLLADVSNSFLFLAAPEADAPSLFESGMLAMHYSTARRPAFRKETAYRETQTDGLMVQRRRLGAAPDDESSNGYAWHLSDEAFTRGVGFEIEFLKLVTTRGWHIDAVGDYLRKYIDLLNDHARVHGFDGKARSAHVPMPGALLDLIPNNIIVRPDGSLVVIDQEWTYRGDCELGFLVFRALAGLGHFVTLWAEPLDSHWLTQGTFFRLAFERAGILATLHDFDRYLDMELAFQEFAVGTGKRVPIDDWAKMRFVTPAGPGEAMHLREKLDHLDRELEEERRTSADRERLIATHLAALNDLQQEAAALEQRVQRQQDEAAHQLEAVRADLTHAQGQATVLQGEASALRTALTEQDARYQFLIRSRSWRLTRPMRGVARLLRNQAPAGDEVRPGVASPIQRVQRVAASAGGYGALARYGVRLLRTEGASGVSSRVRRHLFGAPPQVSETVAVETPAMADAPPPGFPLIVSSAADVASIAQRLSFERHASPVADVVIASDGDLRAWIDCLSAMRQHAQSTPFNVYLLASGLDDASFATLSGIPGVNAALISPEARLSEVDAAVQRSNAEFVFLGTTDVQPGASWLDALVQALRDDTRAAAAGGKIVLPDGHLVEAGRHFQADGALEPIGRGQPANKPSFQVVRAVDAVSDRSMLLRRAAYVQLGGLSVARVDGSLALDDYLMRVLDAGDKVIFAPESIMVQSAENAAPLFGTPQPPAIASFADRWSSQLASISDIRMIAFLLPQYHPIPENDEWWGKGFTEWTNVAKAHPNFAGHYQPHRPADLGYYDLRVPEAREQQARLAREAGLHGFCYYHYWFGGHRLLERPFNEVLALGKPDFPFCICWANENWTRRWDGLESAVLMAQKHSDEDDAAFIRDVLPALKDPRYIRVNGKPLLLVYRVSLLPDPRRTARIWRDIARAEGVELYLAYVQSFDSWARGETPGDFGFDAAVEFPPHGAGVPYETPLENVDPGFQGHVYDYEKSMRQILTKAKPPYTMFRGVMPSWDNTARKQHNGHIFPNASPELYQQWLTETLQFTNSFAQGDERIVFINAWNEWGEGNHLEPDVKYGHAWLDATRRALESVVKR